MIKNFVLYLSLLLMSFNVFGMHKNSVDASRELILLISEGKRILKDGKADRLESFLSRLEDDYDLEQCWYSISAVTRKSYLKSAKQILRRALHKRGFEAYCDRLNLLLGGVYYRQGKFDRAFDFESNVLNSRFVAEEVRALAALNLAAISVVRKDFEGSMCHFNIASLSQDKFSSQRIQALFSLTEAEILFLKGDLEQARTLFEVIHNNEYLLPHEQENVSGYLEQLS